MKKVLVNVLLGVTLGCGSLSVGAQCADGGRVTDGIQFGLPAGYCYYPGGSCPSHPVWSIPSSCQKSPLQSPVLPDKWGAVALDETTGNFDTSFGEHSKEEAKKVALSRCGAGCETVTVYANQCVASALGLQPNGRGFMVQGLDVIRLQAEQKALSQCREKAQNCKIQFTECSLP